MKLGTVKQNNEEIAAILEGNKLFPLRLINEQFDYKWEETVFDLLQNGKFEQLKTWYDDKGKELLVKEADVAVEAELAPLYRNPRKIWGIGLNYTNNKEEKAATPYNDPVSFMKPDTSLIGEGDQINIPQDSTQTTAEAELAIIIGKTCDHVEESEAMNYVAGFTTALDMTEASIHEANLRYLTRAKSFNTFFSFGSYLFTPDEFTSLEKIAVSTYQNGKMKHTNCIENMRYSLPYIVSFHSKVMTLLPGDVLLTGTPGAVVIHKGDTVECMISGMPKLANRVADVVSPL